MTLRGDTHQRSQALQQVGSSVCTAHFVHFWRLTYAQGVHEIFPKLDDSQVELSYGSQMEAVAALEAKLQGAFESAQEVIVGLRSLVHSLQ
jgi:hypothetical protein